MITTRINSFSTRFAANRELLRLRNALTALRLSSKYDLTISYDKASCKYDLDKLDYSETPYSHD